MFPCIRPELYETFALVVVAWLLLRWRRRGVDDEVVIGRYLVLAGAVRFAIEFVRVSLPVLGSLTLAQLISLALVIVGMALLITSRLRLRVST